MNEHELGNVKQEKDLGVIIYSNAKKSDQCTAASEKANMILGLISRNFDQASPDYT